MKLCYKEAINSLITYFNKFKLFVMKIIVTILNYIMTYIIPYIKRSTNSTDKSIRDTYQCAINNKIDELILYITYEKTNDKNLNIDMNKIIIKLSDDVRQIGADEIKLLSITSDNELNKISISNIVINIHEKIDNICKNMNKTLYKTNSIWRIIRKKKKITIIKVITEVQWKIWNIVEPWSQKYCVIKEYMSDINIKEIEDEFVYYPLEETIDYITGEENTYIVFPHTSLSKIMKVIGSIKIKRSITPPGFDILNFR